MQHFTRLLFFASVALGSGFSYDREDGTEGPSHWSGECTSGGFQTPINLCGAVSFPASYNSVAQPDGYTEALGMKGLNNGHTVQMNIADASTAPTISFGDLSMIVGRSSTSANETWEFAQIHLHWGRLGKVDEGSEHYKEGIRYPLEAHLVHYNQKYDNISVAVGSGASDALLVVGVFFELGSVDDDVIYQLSDAVRGLNKVPSVMANKITLSTLSDLFTTGNAAYYAYAGGLTTPGCNTVVTWVVAQTVKTVKAETLNDIKKAKTEPDSNGGKPIAVYGNFRPLQPLNGRTVYSTNNSTSTTCQTVVEPEFKSSHALLHAPSIWLVLLFASAVQMFM